MTDSIRRLLAPSQPRHFPGQRWLNILLRSLHLVGLAGIAGFFLFGASAPDVYWQLTLLSGVLLLMIYVWSSALWLLQLKGQVILFKLILLGLAMRYPAWRAELFIAILVLSGVIAHAPGSVRGWSPLGVGKGRC